MAISKENYKKTIDGFDVKNNPTYQPSGDTTYCNRFAQDVMSEYGYSLPSGYVKDIFEGVYKNVHRNYKSVTYSEAQSRANSGYPTIAITSSKASNSPDKEMPEHIAVVYPSGNTPSETKNVDISQAGKSCFNNGKISQGWLSADISKILFYSWYE